jgi:thiamine-phosphate pyrophosphorylase
VLHKSVYRILDANLNRSREGLRVIEEYLRFVREDRRSSWQVKQWRHTLREIVERLGPERLLSARDAGSDVGKDLPSPSNPVKITPHAITEAGFKRLQEALRVIEEYSAVVEPLVNHLAGKMRFEIYQFEQELFGINPRKRFAQTRLYLLIGTDFCPADKMVEMSSNLLDAGVDCLQLREKTLPDKQYLALADQLANLCHKKEKLFIVNDRPDIALAVGADGVHVGQDDLPVETVRQLLGSEAIIGLSTHSIEQLKTAIEVNPTYIAIGPAYDTTTKPQETTAGLGYISSALNVLKEQGIPGVTIGGISIKNFPELIAIGVDRIAVCSAILTDPNPAEQTQAFAELLSSVLG